MAVKNSPSLREQTYQSLKDEVLSGRIGPGKRLRQEDLAGKLNVSRTPVREALHKLVIEGLIEQVDARGFRVRQLSAEEAEELFDMRSVMEGFSMRYVCEDISDEEVRQLAQFVESSQKALDQGDAEGVFFWNTRYHDLINGRIEQRKRFFHMITNIREYVLRYRKETLFQPVAAQRSIDAHRKILLALQVRDPNLCEYMMRLHIQEAKEDAMRITFHIDPDSLRDRKRLPVP